MTDDRELRELAERNAVPVWLARLEPVYAYLTLVVYVGLAAWSAGTFAWALWLAFE